ncbi:hypothetical protein [Actinoalloteichus hymeniacidonis]|uniref:Glucitol operon activator n=1 Tax=Actinoalloteichus hymeniacidonis TaxID=340345 RepID=A0AAC9HTS2_9PSEU|nr:hypothetical protein [Actinoalloteichus hymeniacidonis]AOS64355.1 glucitol operon activator [Actinoalloteichus hymeniacidonis]MBB5907577.1 DNA-binding transcriptional regulator of glucitol operon [Actinoalloteichus hymeniacidonis]
MRSELLRPRWILLHVAAVVIMITSLRLGWWQWERSQAVGGDGQNLGYAGLWPAIAVFVGYVWWRWTRLELERSAEESEQNAEPGSVEVASASVPEQSPQPTTPAEPQPKESARAAAVRRQLERMRTRGEPGQHGIGDESVPADELSQYNGYLAELSGSDAEPTRKV